MTTPISEGAEQPLYKAKITDESSESRGRKFSILDSDNRLQKHLFAEKINVESQSTLARPEIHGDEVHFSVHDLEGNHLRVQCKIQDFVRALGLNHEQVHSAVKADTLHVNIQDALKPKSRLEELQMLLPRAAGASRGSSGSPGGLVWDVGIMIRKLKNAENPEKIDLEDKLEQVEEGISSEWFENGGVVDNESLEKFRSIIMEYAELAFKDAINESVKKKEKS